MPHVLCLKKQLKNPDTQEWLLAKIIQKLTVLKKHQMPNNLNLIPTIKPLMQTLRYNIWFESSDLRYPDAYINKQNVAPPSEMVLVSNPQ